MPTGHDHRLDEFIRSTHVAQLTHTGMDHAPDMGRTRTGDGVDATNRMSRRTNQGFIRSTFIGQTLDAFDAIGRRRVNRIDRTIRHLTDLGDAPLGNFMRIRLGKPGKKRSHNQCHNTKCSSHFFEPSISFARPTTSAA